MKEKDVFLYCPSVRKRKALEFKVLLKSVFHFLATHNAYLSNIWFKTGTIFFLPALESIFNA